MVENSVCRICHNQDHHTPYRLREMLLGTRDLFDYFQCHTCGCLQIAKIPEDLSHYYPDNYHSADLKRPSLTRKIKPFINRKRVNHVLNQANFLGAVGQTLLKPLSYLEWVVRAGLDQKARILDVGCGKGNILITMAQSGFSQLVGIDPFLIGTMTLAEGIPLVKQDIVALAHAQAESSFDMVMMHHSFEHMPDPRSALQAAYHLLSPQGTLLIRIPTVDCWAWEHYREHWFSADAPRHLYLHSHRSFERLTQEAGFSIQHRLCDTTCGTFMASELYQHDIPNNAPESAKAIFTSAQHRSFRRQIKQLNRVGRGDNVAYWLAKV